MPTPEQNEAGRLIRGAAFALRAEQSQVEAELGPPDGRDARQSGQDSRDSPYEHLLRQAEQQGWPLGDVQLNRWLDRLFQKEWATEARRASRLPLGIVQDPREDLRTQELLINRVGPVFVEMARMFVARSLQRQARGELRGALEELETALRLARQVQHLSPRLMFAIGLRMEGHALRGFQLWLMKGGLDKPVLRDALAILKQFGATPPDLTTVLESQYLLDSEDEEPSSFSARLRFIACQAPWERARRARIRNAIYAGVLNPVGPSSSPAPRHVESRPAEPEIKPTSYALLAASMNLPPRQGPGPNLSADQWGRFVSERCVEARGMDFMLREDVLYSRRFLRLDELAAAVAVYQADHGEPPPRLQDLVPAYLEELPNDPEDGVSIRYSVSNRATVATEGPNPITIPIPLPEK